MPRSTEASPDTSAGQAYDRQRLGAPRSLAVLLVVGGLIGLVAAFTLLVEKIELLTDPEFIPSCNLNPILSCGSVMQTDQAGVFGFPNPILGVAGFAAVTALGVVLVAGAAMARWFWALALVGVTAGVVFVHWLIWQSLYEIGALCPYCMVVWAVMIPIFWFTAAHSVAVLRGRPDGTNVLRAYGLPVVTAWYLTIILLIAVRFWDYWSTLV